jgi:hypothetical protein
MLRPDSYLNTISGAGEVQSPVWVKCVRDASQVRDSGGQVFCTAEEGGLLLTKVAGKLREGGRGISLEVFVEGGVIC